MSRFIICMTVVGFLFGCQAPGHRPAAPSAAASHRQPLFDGLGQYGRRVRTTDPLAQQYFDQGLTLAYAFNHDEAIRSFEAATQVDPQCAMAWWGVALCNGPHINNPIVPPARAAAAWDALQQARHWQSTESAVNQALIAALASRYSARPVEDRRGLDEGYAAAMRDVYARYPDDADVATLYAEAMMDLRPWDLWTSDGAPQPGTQEIIEVLEGVLATAPTNPGAPHLYIHAVEAGPNPALGLAAADRLCDLTPGAGHLLHMPSHIYVLTGRWADASRQNELAIAADRKYQAVSPAQDFFRLYMIHNRHMLSFAAMMEGRRETALRAARDVIASIPDEWGRQNAAMVDGYMAIATEVMMRFGRWDEILGEPQPREYWPIANALWRFARGIALANLGRAAEADAELRAFDAAVQSVPAEAVLAINKAHHILSIARHMLVGEIAYNRGDIETGVRELREAGRLENQLAYMEPPEWIQPTRHALAAILLEANRVPEAEDVYRADLRKWPENGWSLFGLAQCLDRRGATEEAAAVRVQFEKVWANADTKIGSSCMCVKMTGK